MRRSLAFTYSPYSPHRFSCSVIPAARQLACTCLFPAAVTTPSVLNSTITLPSVTEFTAAVWQDRVANPRDAFIRKYKIIVILLLTRELMRGIVYKASKQQPFDTESNRKDNRRVKKIHVTTSGASALWTRADFRK